MSGWFGVDLDGTLAHYVGWNDGVIGPPVDAMVSLVRSWLAEGREVRIVTARVSPEQHEVFIEDQRAKIEAWCEEHIGQKLPVTASKDFGMIELWDDRCVQVVPNTGKRADGMLTTPTIRAEQCAFEGCCEPWTVEWTDGLHNTYRVCKPHAQLLGHRC